MDKFKNIDTSQYREVKRGIITRYVKKTDFEKDVEKIRIPLDGKINYILNSKKTENEKYGTKKAEKEKIILSNHPNKQKNFYEDLKKRKPKNTVKQTIQEEKINKEENKSYIIDQMFPVAPFTNTYSYPREEQKNNFIRDGELVTEKNLTEPENIEVPFYLDRNNYEHPLVHKYTNIDPFDFRAIEEGKKKERKEVDVAVPDYLKRAEEEKKSNPWDSILEEYRQRNMKEDSIPENFRMRDGELTPNSTLLDESSLPEEEVIRDRELNRESAITEKKYTPYKSNLTKDFTIDNSIEKTSRDATNNVYDKEFLAGKEWDMLRDKSFKPSWLRRQLADAASVVSDDLGNAIRQGRAAEAVSNKVRKVYNEKTDELDEDDIPLLEASRPASSRVVDSDYIIHGRDIIQKGKNIRHYKFEGDGGYGNSMVFPLNAYTVSGRNRNDYRDLPSKSMPFTLFSHIRPYEEEIKKKESQTNQYIGYDADGRVKVGDINQFGKGDSVSPLPRYKISEIIREDDKDAVWEKGWLKGKKKKDTGAIKGIRTTRGDRAYTGRVRLVSEGNRPGGHYWEKSIPKDTIYEPKDYDSAYTGLLYYEDEHQMSQNEAQGGKVIIQVGDDVRYVSGSQKMVADVFDEMKSKNGQDWGYFYLLDNGSFALPVTTSKNNISKDMLKKWDGLNVSGGHVMYLTGDTRDINKYKTEGGEISDMDKLFSQIDPDYAPKDLDNAYNKAEGIVIYNNEKDGTYIDIKPNGNRTKKDFIGDENTAYYDTNGKLKTKVSDFMIPINFSGEGELTQDQIDSFVEYVRPYIEDNLIPMESIIRSLDANNLYDEGVKGRVKKNREKDKNISEKDFNRIKEALLKAKIYSKKKKS